MWVDIENSHRIISLAFIGRFGIFILDLDFQNPSLLTKKRARKVCLSRKVYSSDIL